MGGKTPLEERFRYIGFEVYPKQAKPLFDSPEEERKYVEKIRARASQFFFLEREHSLIEIPSLTAFDRSVVLICSILTMLGFFLFPVGQVYVEGLGQLSVSGLGFLLNLGNLSNFLGLVGARLTLIAGLVAGFLVLGLIVALLQLVTMLSTRKSASGKAASRINRLGILPALVWAAAIILSIASVATPAWSFLGIEPLGKSFGLTNLLNLAGWGIWIMFASLLINSSIVGD